MKYINLPKLKNPISRLVFGTAIDTMTSGNNAGGVLDTVFDNGINTFDIARVYGMSERVLGEWIRSRNIRDKVNIITKGCHHDNERKRMTPKDLFADVDTSLHELNTDYIDLYLLHRDDESKPVSDIIEALNELQAQGKILTFGASNWTHIRIVEATDYAKKHGLNGFSVSSPCFSAAKRVFDPWGGSVDISGDENKSAREWYIENNMPVIAYSSLARGFLSGKFKSYDNKSFEDVFGANAPVEYDCPENIALLKRIEDVSNDRGITVAQTALAWLMNHKMNVCAILSPTQYHHIKSDMDAVDIQLTDDEFEYIAG
ncbi:MAG: aldo/keto reductase [Oscillospiraceae bacterium]|nr:aldo/keto reductase [Oscillospiraceae bacterium]